MRNLELEYNELPEDFQLEPSYFYKMDQYRDNELIVTIRTTKKIRAVLSHRIEQKQSAGTHVFSKVDHGLAEALNIETESLLFTEYQMGYIKIKVELLDSETEDDLKDA
jgi:hypothetical protein